MAGDQQQAVAETAPAGANVATGPQLVEHLLEEFQRRPAASRDFGRRQTRLLGALGLRQLDHRFEAQFATGG